MLAGLGALEISYIALVAAMTGAAGIFAIYVLLQQFRNPSRRSSRTRR